MLIAVHHWRKVENPEHNCTLLRSYFILFFNIESSEFLSVPVKIEASPIYMVFGLFWRYEGELCNDTMQKTDGILFL